ncbi:transposase [Mesorhizobium sp. STM 4661]|uniref:transposase n=1 Tax=Mesorhizobium sp. STM 4661 TaxID=1297570 RepID=UPI0002BDCD99|nr:transposase [Mesorhizobium sp. STM 4661]CCV16355.1 Transcriptional regulator syrB [Mesorhizobium sp. STM 4661]
MADPQEAESTQVTADAPAKPIAERTKRTPQPKKAKAKTKQPPGKNGSKPTAKATVEPAPAAHAGRKTYSEKERVQKLAQIQKIIAGGTSKKDAVAQAGISEQTYYHWKKAAAPTSESDELKDLLALEEENKRLKKMLAERLRKENAELKNRLGLA